MLEPWSRCHLYSFTTSHFPRDETSTFIVSNSLWCAWKAIRNHISNLPSAPADTLTLTWSALVHTVRVRWNSSRKAEERQVLFSKTLGADIYFSPQWFIASTTPQPPWLSLWHVYSPLLVLPPSAREHAALDGFPILTPFSTEEKHIQRAKKRNEEEKTILGARSTEGRTCLPLWGPLYSSLVSLECWPWARSAAGFQYEYWWAELYIFETIPLINIA